jgi:hypothetical protein
MCSSRDGEIDTAWANFSVVFYTSFGIAHLFTRFYVISYIQAQFGVQVLSVP